MGLKVERLEDDQVFQDAVLSVHHACMHTFAETGAHKIIENHEGVAYISSVKQLLIQAPLAPGVETPTPPPTGRCSPTPRRRRRR